MLNQTITKRLHHNTCLATIQMNSVLGGLFFHLFSTVQLQIFRVSISDFADTFSSSEKKLGNSVANSAISLIFRIREFNNSAQNTVFGKIP